MGRHDMIKQVFNIEDKWKVIVYYNIDYDFYDIVEEELVNLRLPVKERNNIYYNMRYNLTYAFTTSSANRISVVGFNKHKNKEEYVSSIVHEAEHIKQDILRYYKVNDYGEPPAYLIGYIVSKMYEVFSDFICDC